MSPTPGSARQPSTHNQTGESPPERSSRPSGQTGAAEISGAADGSSLPQDAAGWDDVAAHIDGAFVLLVKTAAGRYRRRCFLTCASAERAARRANDRGEAAWIVLAQLKPVYRVAGGDSDA